MTLTIDQRQDYTLLLNVKSGDPLSPVDLTGAVVEAQIRIDWNTGKIAEFVVTIPDPETGVVNLYLPSAVTATIPPREYRWDAFITRSGTTTKLAYGKVEIVGAITQ